jgi:hypothetical protein
LIAREVDKEPDSNREPHGRKRKASGLPSQSKLFFRHEPKWNLTDAKYSDSIGGKGCSFSQVPAVICNPLHQFRIFTFTSYFIASIVSLSL